MLLTHRHHAQERERETLTRILSDVDILKLSCTPSPCLALATRPDSSSQTPPTPCLNTPAKLKSVLRLSNNSTEYSVCGNYTHTYMHNTYTHIQYTEHINQHRHTTLNTGTPQHWHTSTLAHLNTGTPQHWHTSTLAHLNTGTPQHWHTSTLAHLNTGTPQHWHTSTLAHHTQHRNTSNQAHHTPPKHTTLNRHSILIMGR